MADTISPPAATAERCWEYSYINVASTNPTKLVRSLNDLGAEGWELIAVDDIDPTLGMNSLLAVIRRPIDPLPTPNDTADGWYPDPSGRYDKRYWNGRAWTFHVARTDDKTQHRDPPTRRSPSPDLAQ